MLVWSFVRLGWINPNIFPCLCGFPHFRRYCCLDNVVYQETSGKAKEKVSVRMKRRKRCLTAFVPGETKRDVLLLKLGNLPVVHRQFMVTYLASDC